ncbi:MAG: protein kinase [Proteobacteria bacterium]|nr:protein kinase [Pseudomonadota bacterium]
MSSKQSSYLGRTLARRYHIQRLLGEGSMGQVFTVWDKWKHEQKALKLIDLRRNKVPLEALMRFKAEGDSLKNLDHPSIIKYQDFINEGDIYGLVMEYLPSPNLAQHLKENGPFPVEKAVSLARILAEALDFIHDTRLVHLDLKPSNILISSDSFGKLKIKVLDFGFSQIIGLSGSATGGTLFYMAPEQTGILHKTIDHRADLYALGIITYEVLTGHVPFSDENPGVLVYQHIARSPERPSSSRPDIPRIFEEIVLKLISKDPDDRYRTTGGLLHDLDKYQRLSEERGTPDVVFPLGDEDHWDSFPPTNPFVGREKEKTEFRRIVEQATGTPFKADSSPEDATSDEKTHGRHHRKRTRKRYHHAGGNGGMILLEGHRGIGKTAFLTELYNELQQESGVAWFHSPMKGEYEIPYITLKHILKNLESYLDRLARSDRQIVLKYLKKRFRDQFGIIRDVLPRLSQWMDEALEKSTRQLRTRTVDDYTEVVLNLFKRITRVEKRLVIFIDNFQYVEDSTADLFFSLLEEIGRLPILFIFSYNDEELPSGHREKIDRYLDRPQLHHFILHPQSQTDFSELLQELFSNKLYDLPRLLEPLYTATQGNPSLLRKLLQKIVDARLIYYRDQAWHAKTNEALGLIRSFRQDLVADISFEGWLPRQKEVLRRGAVVLRSFSFYEIRTLVETAPPIEISQEELLRILDRSLQDDILKVSTVNSQRLYSFRDRDVRYTLLNELAPKLRQDLHRTIAGHLEVDILPDSPETAFDIARHLHKAGDRRRAMDYYIDAARLTDDGMFSDRHAETYYNLALLCLKTLPPESVDPETQFDIRYNAVSHTRHYTQEYGKLWEEMLKLEPWIQGDKVRKMKYLGLKLILCNDLGRKDDMLRCWEELLELATEPEDEIHVVESYIYVGSTASHKSYEERVRLLQQGIEMALRHGFHYLVVRSISVHSILLGYLGRFSEAERYVLEISGIMMDRNLPDVLPLVEKWPSMVLEIERGDFQKALEIARSLEPFQYLFDPQTTGIYRTCLARCYGMTGDYGESLKLYDQLLAHTDKAEQRPEMLAVFLGRMQVALKMDDAETTLAFFEQASSLMQLRPDPFMEVMFPVLAATAYMKLNLTSEASSLLKDIRPKVDGLGAPLLECHLDFALARIHWLISKDVKFIEAADRVLENMRTKQISGYYEIYKEDLDTWSQHSEKPPTTSLSSLQSGEANLIKLFEISRKITTTHDLDELFDAALEGAMKITGANHGYLFACCNDSECTPEDISAPRLTRNSRGLPIDEKDYQFSRSILQVVNDTREIVVTRDARREERWNVSRSIREKHLRSVLVAPIVFGDVIKGFIYLDNHHAASLFTLKDKEIVGVFATQVAIALNHAENYAKQEAISAENVRLYEEIREYNLNLEQQVDIRTRELAERTRQLQELNNNLELRVNEELERRLDQEQLLIQHSKMAAMGEMIGMIAHQWRQPLSSISTVAGNMQIHMELDMVEPEEFAGFLTTINEQVQYLSHTINDFRNFFSPKKKAELILLDDIIEKTLKLIGKSLENKAIALKRDYSFSKPVSTYSNELMQVLLNILKNAQDAIMEKNVADPRIVIKGYDEDDFQVLEITDNAGGIDEKNLKRIFEPYFSTKNEKTGTGLGLYMSKTIVEKHCGGELGVENTEDGVRFTLKLPVDSKIP